MWRLPAAIAPSSTSLLRMFFTILTIGSNRSLVAWCFVVQFAECCFG